MSDHPTPARRGRRLQGVVDAFLRVPLAGKIAGANALMLVLVVVALLALTPWSTTTLPKAGVGAGVAAALLLSVAMNISLVIVALRPLHVLQATAARVAAGDFAARVPPSPVADEDVAGVGTTFNHLVDELTADRVRMRRLAAEVIRVGDKERAALGRALHDSAAQALAAVVWQASAALQDEVADAPALRERLAAIADISSVVLDEVRTLAQAAYPRVLDDLGLPAALMTLARQESARDGMEVRVIVEPGADRIGPEQAVVLYRVAEEAVANVARHAEARHATIAIGAADRTAYLAVQDDGRGFDVASTERCGNGTGLFTMRERVALASGRLDISSRQPGGTSLRASLPLSV